jgi:hypothetical protein
VALSENAIRELRAELKALEAGIGVMQTRADAIRQVLGEGRQPSLLGETMLPPTPKSFKSMVLTVIRENPGIRVSAIRTILSERGWMPAGNTDLGHRVYNEVWRMANKTGEVRKADSGGYVCIESP